jgi:hypothetical protein
MKDIKYASEKFEQCFMQRSLEKVRKVIGENNKKFTVEESNLPHFCELVGSSDTDFRDDYGKVVKEPVVERAMLKNVVQVLTDDNLMECFSVMSGYDVTDTEVDQCYDMLYKVVCSKSNQDLMSLVRMHTVFNDKDLEF